MQKRLKILCEVQGPSCYVTIDSIDTTVVEMEDENNRGDAPQFAGEIESLLKFNCGVGVKEMGCIPVVEQFLRLQLNELVTKCIKLCKMRSGNTIQLQDLLFIYAKNESKFARLVKHMIFKDKQHKSKFSSAMGDGCQLSDYYPTGTEFETISLKFESW